MAFPSTPILDNFNRADETPLANGTWATSFGDANGFRVISNQCLPADATFGGSIWTPTSFRETEVYITIVTRQSGSSAFIYLEYRITNPGAAFSGYALKVPANTLSGTWTLNKITAGVTASLTTWSQSVQNGDSVGIRVLGSQHQPYYRPSGGSWGPVGVAFSDATFSAAGQIGIEGDVYGPGQTFDDFGGGTSLPGLVQDAPFVIFGRGAA